MSEEQSHLVLRNDEGDVFAIPRDVVEQHKVPDDQKDEVESGDEVQGFQFSGSYLSFGPSTRLQR